MSIDAQAVLDAFDGFPFGVGDRDRWALAAALRAAVDQVLPEDICDHGSSLASQRLVSRRHFMSIISDLEGVV